MRMQGETARVYRGCVDKKGGRMMEPLNVTLALLRAILELIDKARSLEELRESVKRIMGDEKEKASAPTKDR